MITKIFRMFRLSFALSALLVLSANALAQDTNFWIFLCFGQSNMEGFPGIEEQDIDVQIENNTLTVHGERKFEKEEKEENYRRVERQYCSFTRTFTLPNTVDAEQVQAHYDKGVLKIQLAKKAEAKPKQIKVNVGSQKPLEAKEAKSASRAA